MSLKFKDPSWMVAGGAVFVVVGALAVYGLHGSPDMAIQSGSLLEKSTAPDDDETPVKQVLPDTHLLPGSAGTDPVLMLVNGSRVNVIRSFVELRPEQVIDQYEKLARGNGATEIERTDASSGSLSSYSPKFGPNLPALEAQSLALSAKAARVDNSQVHAVTWLDRRGRRVSVHTRPGEEKGSWYFVMVFENPLVVLGAAGGRDNPGADLPGIPRPPQARRLLSMSGFAVSGFSTAIYESHVSAEASRRFYEEYLPANGWQAAQMAEPGRQIVANAGGLVFQKDGALICVLTDPATRADAVQTSLFLFEIP